MRFNYYPIKTIRGERPVWDTVHRQGYAVPVIMGINTTFELVAPEHSPHTIIGFLIQYGDFGSIVGFTTYGNTTGTYSIRQKNAAASVMYELWKKKFRASELGVLSLHWAGV